MLGYDPLWHILRRYLTGCGHCKKLAPIYEQLGQTYKNEPNCVIARVDADGHRTLGERCVFIMCGVVFPSVPGNVKSSFKVK